MRWPDVRCAAPTGRSGPKTRRHVCEEGGRVTVAQDWNEKAVFLAARDLAPADREAFLRGACPDVRHFQRMMALLSHASDDADDPGGLPDLPTSSSDNKGNHAQRIKTYEIVRELGEGGMGTVYLARDPVLDRQVALKVIARHLTHSPQAVARFTREARIAANLKHPRIVAVHAFDNDGEHHFLVCEHVEGPSLAEVIARQQAMNREPTDRSTRESWYAYTIETIAGVAEALEAAHRASVIHRDVKPSNILMDAALGPRLTDFGIATRPDGETATHPSEILGSCYYMSPEQVGGGSARIDCRSDLFALGVVLYEMLALRRPFDGDRTETVLARILAQSPQPLHLLDPCVPPRLEAITMKCLEKNAEDRYRSAGELATDLRGLLVDRRVAVPMGQCPRQSSAPRYGRRIAAIVGLFIAILGLLGAFIAGGSPRAPAARAQVVLTVTGASGPVVWYARRWDTGRGSYMPAVRLGDSVALAAALTPGFYRIVVVDAAGGFADFSDFIESGAESAYEVQMVNPVMALDGMRRFDPYAAALPRSLAEYADPIGGPDGRELPLLSAFWMDETEVTNAQFKAYVDATGSTAPAFWSGVDLESVAEYPVVGITRSEMMSYALWCGKRLPTADEWLFAAQLPEYRGESVRWDTDAQPIDSWPARSTASSAGQFETDQPLLSYLNFCAPARGEPEFATSMGLHHMFTNVHEMTASVSATPTETLALVAGAARSPSDQTRVRLTIEQLRLSTRDIAVGFRCVRSDRPPLGESRQ